MIIVIIKELKKYSYQYYTSQNFVNFHYKLQETFSGNNYKTALTLICNLIERSNLKLTANLFGFNLKQIAGNLQISSENKNALLKCSDICVQYILSARNLHREI
jgi:hypothetical protein